jgi:hypothetical protein
MDPYLEGDLWTTLHVRLATEIADQLNPKLRPRYAALAEQRFIMTTLEEVTISTSDIYPDVGIRKGASRVMREKKPTRLEAPLQMATVMPSRVPHTWIEIRDVARRKVVTVIEFLSPANKQGSGRKRYLRKRQSILASSVHLMEIDLQHKGKRVPMTGSLPAVPYFVFLSRGERRPLTEIWPIPLDQPLPTVPVPLRAPDQDVALDLQQAFASVYEHCSYDLLVDYSKPPEITLPENEMAWLKKRIKAVGKRS